MNSKFLLLDKYLELEPVKFSTIVNNFSVDRIIKFIDYYSNSKSLPQLINILNINILADCFPKLKKTTLEKIYIKVDVEILCNIINHIKNNIDREKIIDDLPTNIKEQVTEFLNYPKNTAGKIMSTGMLIVKNSYSMKEILKIIRKVKHKNIDPIYVESTNGEFIGKIGLAEVINNNLSVLVKDLKITSVPTIKAMAHKDDIIELVTKAKLSQVPVVNSQNRFLGVVSERSLFNTIQEDAISKLQTMTGASKDEEALSPPLFAVRKRLPWLNINLLTVFLAASVVALFEDTIAKYTALAVLLPVVAGQSGNTGAQGLAVVMRGLTLREIRNSHWIKICTKEMFTGAMNGLAVGVFTALGVYLWSKSLGLTLVAGISMVLSMTISSVAGGIVPIILRIFRQDPAQSASIILTTITDITAFFTFLWLATILGKIIPLS